MLQVIQIKPIEWLVDSKIETENQRSLSTQRLWKELASFDWWV